ncbi:MAG: glycosyltransferase N-terminal domain-containing protein [Bacteroidota bacterium]|nr:3-deoxy-D-manno-octulosonic acid transferase [Odoribacter sp.]MDP3642066.1 glycosyltransferase N-terminal domain-containing protein [Bacteroidota bacterium]
MKALYNISIFFYSVLIKLAAPFNLKASQINNGRKQTFAGIKAIINHDRPIIWVHCASLGEFEQGRPVIEIIRKQHPKYQILLTFFSPSGYEIRKNYELADYIFYLPADTKKNALMLIELVRPEIVFFVKYEFWFHYINELRNANIPLYLFSAIFRENQIFFRNSPWGKWYRKILGGFEHLFVQDEKSVELLNQIGIHQVTQVGDTRFDRVAEIALSGKNIPIVEKFKGDSQLVVAGSTWKPDEELLIQYIHSHPETKFIIAPHETKQSNVERLISLLKSPVICYTEATEESVMNKQVLIVDTIGILSSIYKYADLAYIGGGFGVGIHNTLEAAIFGTPIVFGPNYLKFHEATSMVKLGIAFPVADYTTFQTTITHLLTDTQKRNLISNACTVFIRQNIGATQLILNKVFNNS